MLYSKIYSRSVLFRQSLVSALKDWWSFWPNRLYLVISLFFQSVLWSGSYFIYQILIDDLLIFHYTVDFGIDSAGKAIRLFILPLVALVFLVVNFIVSLVGANSKQAHRLWHLLGFTSGLVQVLMAFALLAVYLINFLA